MSGKWAVKIGGKSRFLAEHGLGQLGRGEGRRQSGDMPEGQVRPGFRQRGRSLAVRLTEGQRCRAPGVPKQGQAQRGRLSQPRPAERREAAT